MKVTNKIEIDYAELPTGVKLSIAEVLSLSCGTIATLTGKTLYEEVERFRYKLCEFIAHKNISNKNAYESFELYQEEMQ
jgi:hypothetical protein